jgi:hypothetical protein
MADGREGDSTALNRISNGGASIVGHQRPFTGRRWPATAIQGLEQEADDTLAGVQREEERYEQFVRSSSHVIGRLWADAWFAAFG